MRKEIVIPQNCPTCDSVLEKVNSQLFCRNIKCPARTHKNIEHFAKTIGIKGLGPAAIKNLNLTHFYEIYSLTKEDLAIRLNSEKLAEKIYLEIEKSKEADLGTVVAAFGIPKVGKVIAQKLAKVASLEHLTKDKCIELGIGNVASTNIMEFINYEYPIIKDKLPFISLHNAGNTILPAIPECPNKVKICITGKLSSFKTKAEAAKELELLGFTVVDSLTKDVAILVDEENRGSSKRVKAEQLGLLIVDNIKTFIQEKKTHEYNK